MKREEVVFSKTNTIHARLRVCSEVPTFIQSVQFSRQLYPIDKTLFHIPSLPPLIHLFTVRAKKLHRCFLAWNSFPTLIFSHTRVLCLREETRLSAQANQFPGISEHENPISKLIGRSAWDMDQGRVPAVPDDGTGNHFT